MKFSNVNDNKNLISTSLGFYLYELLGVDYSGVYLSNIELKSVADSMGIEVQLTDNHRVFGEMLRIAKEEGRLAEALEKIKELFAKRLETYDELSQSFPGAATCIEEWQIKANRAIRKIDSAIKEVKNESNS